MLTNRILLIIGLAAVITILAAGCSDDDDDGPVGPGSDSPVGSYVAVIQSDGYTSMPSVSPTTIGLIGESFPVTISSGLLLTAYDGYPFRSDQSTQLTEQGDGSYTGSYEVNTLSPTISFDFTIAWDSTAQQWEADVTTEYDTDNDDDPEETGSFTAVFKPRLNWSAYSGTWRAAVIYTDAETGFHELQVESAAVEGNGSLHGAWFYDDGSVIKAMVYSQGDDEALVFQMQSLGTSYMHITVSEHELPTSGTIDPDPTNWAVAAGQSDVHAVPVSRLASFVDDNVLLSINGQTEFDTDGLDPEDTSPYFGDDLVGVDVVMDIVSDGTMEVTMGPEQRTLYYGYMEAGGNGYLAGTRIDTSATYFNINYFVLELDQSNATTGNGFMQGYDVPDLNSNGEMEDDEIEVIDNEGILTFGTGCNPDLFDFITTL